MDNEAPNYAKWIPEAGGYVSNGSVVSKSPMYDSNGQFQLNIDPNVLAAQPAANPSTAQNQPQVANTVQGNVGVTGANIQGSGTDANATATGIGSLGSLSQNTSNPLGSAVSSPATKSIIAGDTILSPVDEVNKEYQEAVARGDLQGQINALTKASRINGVDYSAEIQNLTKQRQNKIQNIDDQYLAQLNQALQAGDYDTYNKLLQEQSTWREGVGYQDAMQQKYQADQQELVIQYEGAFLRGAQDIANQIYQMTQSILNFQYNPMQDTSLQIAQQYATSAVKEQMNATGMYYSSMTQAAITKAVAELVPQYQKMARQEAIENLNLLQSTANFLVGLEETQFNMWKTQVQLQFDANAEKRAQVQAAIQSANARGYYTNEEAALVGVPAGSESYESRTRAIEKQEEIEREQRKLNQNMQLAQFEAELKAQLTAQEYALKTNYTLSTKGSNGGSGGSGGNGGSGSGEAETLGGLTFAQYKSMISDNVKNGTLSIEDAISRVNNNIDLSTAQKEAVIENAKKQASGLLGSVDYSLETPGGSLNATTLKGNLATWFETGDTSASTQLAAVEDVIKNAKSWSDAWSALSTAKIKGADGTYNAIDSSLISSLKGTDREKLQQLSQYLSAAAKVEEDDSVTMYDMLGQMASDGTISNETRNRMAKYTINNSIANTSFNSNEKTNIKKLDEITDEIGQAAPYMSTGEITNTYKKLFENIADTKNFDLDKRDVTFNSSRGDSIIDMGANLDEYISINDKGDKSKQLGIVYAINKLGGYGGQKSALSGVTAKEKEKVVKDLTQELYDLAQDKLSKGYTGLKDIKNYITLKD